MADKLKQRRITRLRHDAVVDAACFITRQQPGSGFCVATFKRKGLQNGSLRHRHEQFRLQWPIRRIAQRDVERRRGDLIHEVDAGIDLSDLNRLRVDEAGVGRDPRILRDQVRGEKEGTKNRLHAAMVIQARSGVCKRTVKRRAGVMAAF